MPDPEFPAAPSERQLNDDRVARDRRGSSVETRFQGLVRSPLRALLLRFLHSRTAESFAIDALMQASGRMRVDVENCLQELVAFGVVRRGPDPSTLYTAVQPESDTAREQLDKFLERRAAISHEERSPAAQRFREAIGSDEKMLVVFEWIRTAAKSDISVLILGPTGSGKEVVARMIHELSSRNSGRFQALNCAALPDELFESELFGYERGAFTGAEDRKPGRLELADSGTLLLDEIADLSPAAQAKLLRVLEERRFERLGGNKSIEVNLRLVSATNRPLEQLVRDGRFREDLYYRVNAFSIRLPSLRERASDIPVLAQQLLARYCAANGLDGNAKIFSKESLARLRMYDWPGNIRELESTVSRAALSAADRVIRVADISFLSVDGVSEGEVHHRLPSLHDAERAYVARVLDSVAWNKKRAAQILEISRGTLYRKIEEYGLEPRGYNNEPTRIAATDSPVRRL